MITALTVIYVIVCIFLILVVLLQAGKGGGMGSAFGGSGTQTVFGGAGAGNFLTRITVICAMLFMMLSATLAYLSSSSEKALERASEAVKLREQARKEALVKKSAKAKQGATDQGGKPSTEQNAGQTAPSSPSSESEPSDVPPAEKESSEVPPEQSQQPPSLDRQQKQPVRAPQKPANPKPQRGPWP